MADENLEQVMVEEYAIQERLPRLRKPDERSKPLGLTLDDLDSTPRCVRRSDEALIINSCGGYPSYVTC
jgi:hypothetical protein